MAPADLDTRDVSCGRMTVETVSAAQVRGKRTRRERETREVRSRDDCMYTVDRPPIFLRPHWHLAMNGSTLFLPRAV